jgi:hypothetical protein
MEKIRATKDLSRTIVALFNEFNTKLMAYYLEKLGQQKTLE